MGLSDDQRAMLRLLAQREQGYEDIAALMGLSVDDVRAKVKDALAQLEQEGVAPPPLPADPPVAIAPQPPAPAPELPAAEEPEPAASKPEPAVVPEPVPAPAAPAAATEKPAPRAPRRRSSGPPKISMPSGQGARAAIAAGVAVLALVIVVLIVSGGGGGGDSDSGTTTSAAETTATETKASGEAETTPTSNNAEVTKAVLTSVDGGDATGAAIFGRVKNSLALQVSAKGLDQLPAGQGYTIWLAQSPQRMLPLASSPVDKKGQIGAQFEVPTEVLAYLANGTFDQLVITRTVNSALNAALKKATKEERAPAYTGTEVLSGTVTGPIVGAAKREKEAE
jgi:hypothetical protein